METTIETDNTIDWGAREAEVGTRLAGPSEIVAVTRPSAEEIASMAGNAVTPEVVRAVWHAEEVERVYGQMGHMGG